MNKFSSFFFPPTIASAILVVIILQVISPEKDMELSTFVLLLAIFPISITISGMTMIKNSSTQSSLSLLRNLNMKTLGKVAVIFGISETILTVIVFLLMSLFLSDVII